MKKIILLSIFFVLLAFSSIIAQHQNAGQTYMSGLKMGCGAKALALGGAFTAGQDVSSIYWNPAGISRIKKNTMLFDYNNFMSSMDVQKGMLAFVYSLDTNSGKLLKEISKVIKVAGVYANYINYGDFEEVLEDRTVTGRVFNAGEMEYALSVAGKLGDKWNGGLSLKYLMAFYDDYVYHASAFDLGIQRSFLKGRLTTGFALHNIGIVFDSTTGVSTDSLLGTPAFFAAGINFVSRRSGHRFLFDINKPIDEFTTYRLGVEMKVNKKIYLRGGYRFLFSEFEYWSRILAGDEVTYTRDNMFSWSTGIGFKILKNTVVDIAVLGVNAIQSMPITQVSVSHRL